MGGLLILISAMAVEMRCVFRTGEEVQSHARNAAIAEASTETGALRLRAFQVRCPHPAFRVLKPLVRKAGLEMIQTQVMIFAGTEAGD